MNEMKVGNVFLPGLEVLFLVRSGLTSASQPSQSHLLFTQILRTVLEIYPDYSLSHITYDPFLEKKGAASDDEKDCQDSEQIASDVNTTVSVLEIK